MSIERVFYLHLLKYDFSSKYYQQLAIAAIFFNRPIVACFEGRGRHHTMSITL